MSESPQHLQSDSSQFFPLDLSNGSRTRKMAFQTTAHLVHGPVWPEESASEFKPDSLPGSPVLSSSLAYDSDNKSIISDDIDLYDAWCIC